MRFYISSLFSFKTINIMGTKYNKTLRVRDRIKPLVFHGKFGNEKTGVFDYTEGGKKWGDFTQEELIAFAKCHNKKTVDHHLIGEIPTGKVKEVSPAPADK